MSEGNKIYSGADDWQALHELPAGAILVDESGHAYQVERHKFQQTETWACPVSDEYAFIVRQGPDGDGGSRVGTNRPVGYLTLIWTPPT